MTRAHRGLFVVLEGIDGVGKSTLLRALARALRRRGFSVGVRREPADRRLGALAQSTAAEDPWTGAVYFTVDRHLAAPALEREIARRDVVLQDRSFYSTLAYQGSALPPADRRRLAQLQRSAARVPDRVVLLNLDPTEALHRLGGRNSRRGPLERLRTLERVARAYRRLARSNRWQVLDARAPPATLVEQVLGTLKLRGPSLRTRPRRRRR
ncbi:MAG: dTMP kinase [Thermoplasmata archaeon]|jgi:dTMP kinase